MKIRKLCFCISLSLTSTFGLAANYANEPTFDCTVAETKLYIEQVTANVFAPSPIATPEEFEKAFMEAESAKAAAGDGDSASCVSILSDGKLTDEWKNIVDSVRNLDISFSFSGFDAAVLQELLDKAKEKTTEEFTNAMDALGEDLCALISTENIEGMLLDAVNKKYGLNSRSLRFEEFAGDLTEEALLGADKNILLLLSEDKLKSEISNESKQEMRALRKELWDNF
jgi:hypothetical protein